MMGLLSHLASIITLLATTALAQSAQVVSYSNSNHGISVNVPANTASSGSGSIYFQISAPSGTQWVGFGQGTGMTGANMFVVYAADSSNVTISPRLGTGHVMPEFNSDAQVSLLAGSGISSDGSMVANVRCDSCLSWSGGSMNLTSSSSKWIWSYKSGSALNTDDQSAQIDQHDNQGTFNLDLTKGTGGSSNNPFVAAADTSSSSASPSASASGVASQSTTGTATSTSAVSQSSSLTRSSTAAASGTNSVSNPVASSSPNSDSGSTYASGSREGASDNSATLILAHGVIMSILFVALFPLASLTLYLPTSMKVRYIHAPLQILATIMVIAGMALGIVLAQRFHQLDVCHTILGLIIVVSLVLFQPAMGIYQHLHYSKTGGRSVFGHLHRWLGRTLLILGAINGGLGLQLSGNTAGYVPYGVVAGIVFLVYISVLFWAWRRGPSSQELESQKGFSNRGFEMHRPRDVGHARLGSSEGGRSAYRQQRAQARQNNRF